MFKSLKKTLGKSVVSQYFPCALTRTRCLVWTYEMLAMSRRWRPSAGPETPWTSWSSPDNRDLRYCISKNSQKIAHFIWLRMRCAMSYMHTLHCVVFQSLEAPHCFTLNSSNKCKRMVQCVLCWTTPSDVSAVLCVGVCSFTIKCPLDTKRNEQKHLWLKTYLVS